ncbi:hypothetical protein KA050_04395, partial [Candidatus Gracilibacteria bacterium]|nr:hypothetical protein [Candidatus Gracilibacteria bacterium]
SEYTKKTIREHEEWNKDWGLCLPDELFDFIEQEILEAERRGEEKNEKSKNDAYHERDMLVCTLTKLFPAYLARHSEEEEWEYDWRWIVYIDIPTGQVSWHIHDSERAMFDHLEVKENNWDGHNTQRKYERLLAISSLK